VYLLAVLILVAGFLRGPGGRPAPVGPCIRRKPFSPARPARGGESSVCSHRFATFIVAFTMGGLNYVTTCCRPAAAA